MTDISNAVRGLSPKGASGGGQGTTVDQDRPQPGGQISLGTIGDDQAYSSPPPVGQHQTCRPVQPRAISAGLSPSEVGIMRAHEAGYQPDLMPTADEQKVGKLREALIADHESGSPLLPEAPEQVFARYGSLDTCSPSLEPAEEHVRNLDELYLSPPAKKVGLDAVNPFPPGFHSVISPQWEPLEDELSLDHHPVESGSSYLSQSCLMFEPSSPEPFEPSSDASTPVSPLVLSPPVEQQLENSKHPQPVSPPTSHMEQQRGNLDHVQAVHNLAEDPSAVTKYSSILSRDVSSTSTESGNLFSFPVTDGRSESHWDTEKEIVRREMPEEDPVPGIYSLSAMGTALVEPLEQSYDAQPRSDYETLPSRLPPSPVEIFRKAIGTTKRIHEIIKENQTDAQSTAAKLSTTRGRRGRTAVRRSRRNGEDATTANSSQLRQPVAPSNPQDSESISGSSEKPPPSEVLEALERGGDTRRQRLGSGLFKPRRRELNDSEDKECGDYN